MASCTCHEIEELFEWRVDPWGKKWRLNVTDTGTEYFIVDGNGMTSTEPYCKIHGRFEQPYFF